MRNFLSFCKRQIVQIYKGDLSVLTNKIKKIYPHLIDFPLCILVIPFVIIIRFLSPLLLIRWYGVIATRIGHFAANIELYLCEQKAGINVPEKKYFDIFFIEDKPVWGHFVRSQ